MKRIVVLLFIFFNLEMTAQTAFDFFYNTSYRNPAFGNDNKWQLDINSSTWYNQLPLGIFQYQGNLLYNPKKGIGFSTGISQQSLGKAITQTESRLMGKYVMLINFKNQLNFGLGLIHQNLIYDENQLTTGLDINSFQYSFGQEVSRNSVVRIPIGMDYNTKKYQLGAYFQYSLNGEHPFGLYVRAQDYEKVFEKFTLKNFNGLAVFQDRLNPQIQLVNHTQFDNYQIDFSLAYNIANTEKNLFSIGSGIHYKWKVFDINYLLQMNFQKIGPSHQIGLKCYF